MSTTRIVFILASMLLSPPQNCMAQGTPNKLQFKISVIGSATAYPGASIASGDFNNDGIPDLLTTGEAGILCCALLALGHGDGTFGRFTSVAPISSPNFTAVGDFNLDGNLDYVELVFNTSDVHVGIGDGKGKFSTGAAAFVAYGIPNDVIVADVNGDGKPDVIGTSIGAPGEYLWVMIGNGDGTFQKLKYFNVPGNNSYPVGIALGDFNGDGKLDAVVNSFDTTTNSGTIELLLGNGDGTFQPATSLNVGVGWTLSPVVADFNNDGKLDVAVLNTPNSVTVLLGNGDGTFRSPTTYQAGLNVWWLAVADFDGDATQDLAVAQWGPQYGLHGSYISILTGKGDGTFNPPVLFPVDSQPMQLVVSDFNRDGKPDIATANQKRGTTNILLNETVWP